MNKKLIMIVSILLSVCCLSVIIVSASGDMAADTAETEIAKTQIISEKVYYAYYNAGSGKGAVAFCLNNAFTAYGTTDSNIKLCTKDEAGNYTTLYNIPQNKVGTWFYGKSEFSVETPAEINNLLGGLSGLGITVKSDKVNVAFELLNQPVETGKNYFIYIPENYFIDENNIGNAGAYIEIPADKINGYTGDLIADLKTAASGFYDTAIFGVESIFGVLSK